jgi:hypothetical protein
MIRTATKSGPRGKRRKNETHYKTIKLKGGICSDCRKGVCRECDSLNCKCKHLRLP